ncbi:MAG: flagellar assembly protein FliH [Treponema sp.]|jgi:flagellar assembly protein FliH|nr:flagellar assembly protein FliH [Treponema sp.]
MLKAVFRPSELITLTDKIVIDSPTSYPDLAHLKVEEAVEDVAIVEEYTGPTADDLRREAELFKADWEVEKEKMVADAKLEAENIIKDAEKTASEEIQRKSDEAQVIKQQAEEEAKKIIAGANTKAAELEKEVRQTLDAERKDARDKGMNEGLEKGFADGNAEVKRLIERTQVVLERAQDKRGEILSETEKEVIDLVLLISRKVIKIISENQRNVIVSNVVQALRKVRSKGNVIIRVNMADLNIATEHKQEFINLMEGRQSIQILEDTSVDPGGCIIETDFGEIDARISSQLAELESKILEVSPMKSNIKDNLPPPVIRTANLNADLAASSALSSLEASKDSGGSPKAAADDNQELSPAANAALTASAALAALATMGSKGRRDTDKKMVVT